MSFIDFFILLTSKGLGFIESRELGEALLNNPADKRYTHKDSLDRGLCNVFHCSRGLPPPTHKQSAESLFDAPLTTRVLMRC